LTKISLQDNKPLAMVSPNLAQPQASDKRIGKIIPFADKYKCLFCEVDLYL
jgi:hypothetical protein